MTSPSPMADAPKPLTLDEMLPGWISSTEQSLDRMRHVEAYKDNRASILPQCQAAIAHAIKCLDEMRAEVTASRAALAASPAPAEAALSFNRNDAVKLLRVLGGDDPEGLDHGDREKFAAKIRKFLTASTAATDKDGGR